MPPAPGELDFLKTDAPFHKFLSLNCDCVVGLIPYSRKAFEGIPLTIGSFSHQETQDIKNSYTPGSAVNLNNVYRRQLKEIAQVAADLHHQQHDQGMAFLKQYWGVDSINHDLREHQIHLDLSGTKIALKYYNDPVYYAWFTAGCLMAAPKDVVETASKQGVLIAYPVKQGIAAEVLALPSEAEGDNETVLSPLEIPKDLGSEQGEGIFHSIYASQPTLIVINYPYFPTNSTLPKQS